jgi:hypothetical protein
MPASPRPGLILQHDHGRAHPLELARHMTGRAGIGIAVIDIDQQPVLGQHLADAPGFGDDVRPGDIAEIGQTVMAGGKTEAGQEQVLREAGGDGCREGVIDTDERRDCRASPQFRTQLSAGVRGGQEPP